MKDKERRRKTEEDEAIFGVPITKYTVSVAACLVIIACIYVSADFSGVSGFAVQPAESEVIESDGICNSDNEDDIDCLCSAQGGFVCGNDEYCDQWIYASDTWDCCRKCMKLKTCAEQNGKICTSDERCDLYYGALDRNDCCALCLPK